MKRLALLAAAAAALTVSACETATPYQPLGTRGTQASGGYADTQLEQNRWSVTFSGNSLTSRERVERYLLYRASELTLQQGYDWFTTVDRNTERKTDYYGDSFNDFGGGYFGPRWGLYRRGYGWGYGYGGFGGGFGGGYGGFGGFGGGPVDLQQVSKYTATSEILMGRGPKPPGDRRAFDARSVVGHLRGQVQYPGQPGPAGR